MSRVLAVDLGEKNVGLAISDQLGWTAQGLPNLNYQNNQQAIAEIARLTKEYDVVEVVVGMPVNMNGSLGKQARRASKFAEELGTRLKLPVRIWDERLTTMQAQRLLLQASLSRKKRRSKIDRLAAQLILQSYLDSRGQLEDVSKDNTE